MGVDAVHGIARFRSHAGRWRDAKNRPLLVHPFFLPMILMNPLRCQLGSLSRRFVLLSLGLPAFLSAAPSRGKEVVEPAIRTKPLPELHIAGRQVLIADGREVWLQGVNVVSLEYTLTGQHMAEAIRVAITEWKANTIRLPVKDTYWLGRDPAQKDGGLAYRQLVTDTIEQIVSLGAYAVLDLHRFGAVKPTDIEFWQSAAAHFRNHPGVLFDIFNEPHSISWEVWRNGGWVSERKEKTADEDAFMSADESAKNRAGFQSPGMQKLVEAIRATGARNVIIAGGLDWAYDLSGIVDGYALSDPSGHGIMYSTHIYNWKRDWADAVMRTADKYAIFVGEVGADVKKMSFIKLELQEDPLTWVPDMLGLIQEHRFSWTAWSFNPGTTPVLISDWKFTPTPFWGAFAKAALSGHRFELARMR